VTTTLLYGDLRTGRIVDVIDATGCSWAQESNAAGRIDQVTVPEDVVRALNLRDTCQAARSFLAVDLDGRLQEAGPVWSRMWDDAGRNPTLTLGAAGMWSLFDHRFVLDVLKANLPLQQRGYRVDNATLGGIAKQLVRRTMAWAGGDLPLVFGQGAEAGDRTEDFPGWKLLRVGDQLRELTQREVAAPDIRFRPRYTADRLGIEWVMETGDEDSPLLVQAGDDWVFDANVPRGPVRKIKTDEDATVMGMAAYLTGEGSEADTLMVDAYDPTLVDAGWPRLEVEESRSGVSDQATLGGHAENLRDRSARPIEVWSVVVRAEAAAEVLAGHYARVAPNRGSAWLGGAGETYMRVKTKSGDLGDDVTLTMYSVRGQV